MKNIYSTAYRERTLPDADFTAENLDALDDEAAGLVFLDTYPRREARADGLKAWRQTRAVRPALSVLIDALAAHAASKDWTRERRQFIPLPATWLRGRRWEDDVSGLQLAPALAQRIARWQQAAQGKAAASMAAIEAASLAAGDAAMARARKARMSSTGLQVVERSAAPAAVVADVASVFRRQA